MCGVESVLGNTLEWFRSEGYSVGLATLLSPRRTVAAADHYTGMRFVVAIDGADAPTAVSTLVRLMRDVHSEVDR